VADLSAFAAPGIHARIGADLAVFGGILRCNQCGTEQPLGDIGGNLAHGWPECCGLTMTWVTAKLLAAEQREVPPGYRLEAVPDSGVGGAWRLVAGKRCRRQSGAGRAYCRKPAVAEVNRGYMRSGQMHENWWAYCADHLYGRWVEDGQVWCWILKADEDDG
jgi:hypothetical protein